MGGDIELPSEFGSAHAEFRHRNTRISSRPSTVGVLTPVMAGDGIKKHLHCEQSLKKLERLLLCRLSLVRYSCHLSRDEFQGR